MGIEDLTPKKSEEPIISSNQQEKVDTMRVEAINALRVSPESPEATEAFTKWYDREYEKFVQSGERDPYPLDWSVVELYIEAGQYKLAYDKLNELADVAWEARDDEWVKKCDDKIIEINNRDRSV